jgi:hypothetical protein
LIVVAEIYLLPEFFIVTEMYSSPFELLTSCAFSTEITPFSVAMLDAELYAAYPPNFQSSEDNLGLFLREKCLFCQSMISSDEKVRHWDHGVVYCHVAFPVFAKSTWIFHINYISCVFYHTTP